MRKMSFTSPIAQSRIERIQYLLRREDMTAIEIAEGIHVHKRTAQEYIRHLHSLGLIHISSWRKFVRKHVGDMHVALYCWGKAKDAPKPPATPLADLRRRYYYNPDRIDTIRAKARAKHWKAKRDWTAAWIPNRSAA